MALLSVKTIFCQNLVPNPGFEVFTSCPDLSQDPNEINLAIPWYNPTTSSPDLYDTCSDPGLAGVPHNFNGYQHPHSGHAYAGVYVYGGSSAREYLQVELLDTLVAGEQYSVEFYVNLTVNFSYHCAIDEIELLLSNNPITSGNVYYLNYTAQIKSPPGVFITDTLNWTLVSGVYTALGGERYITIGNFKDDNNTDTIDVDPQSTAKQSYYYIDDVSITQITGVDETENNFVFNIYPNPASNKVTIENNKHIGSIFLYDMLGNVIKETSLNDIRTEIDVSNLTGGVYFLKSGFTSQKLI
ncbi:MAG TPA: T9SS type A sorting domain-containing protein, partial [Flavobacteriales bacterium]|nr:T9SS type A sorting domain-containing protein [Flavobacteriales bacterium]